MSIQTSIFDNTKESKPNQAIKLLKEFEDITNYRNKLGYIVGYSGGKDSEVLLDLFIKSKVNFIAIHNHTTIDAPETVYHIRKKFYELELKGYKCKIHYPKYSFSQLCIKKNMLPTRICRFCCSHLKEVEIQEYKFATHSFGVRKLESKKRNDNRDSIETRNNKNYKDNKTYHFDKSENVKQESACYTNNYLIINPIAYWSEIDIWNYIEENKLIINPLYYEGFNRIGCIGCPMAGKKKKKKEFERYPKYFNRYLYIANEIIKNRILYNLPNKYGFKKGIEYLDWWLKE